MKKIISLLAIYACLGVLAVSGFANVIELKAETPSAVQDQCTDESKAAWYADFTKFRIPDPPKAYEAAKKYLAACPKEEGPIPTYLKKWSAQYDKDARKTRFQPLLYGDKKYAEAFALGKDILLDEPENLSVILNLGYAGFQFAAPATKNESFNADALTYARKAIQMIESGKVPDTWSPFKGKDDTLAYLYHVVGRLTLTSNPADALAALIKSLKAETDLKKEPLEYYFVAAAYETGPYLKLAADYKSRFDGKPESPESKLALANIEQVIDRMIDAYARAVALAGTDPKHQVNKKEWIESLTTWYKYRHNQSDAGLNEMIASVLSKPLPSEPTALITLPASATTTTAPASGIVSSSGSTSSTGASVSPATNKANTTSGSSLPTAPKVASTTATTVTTKPVSTTSAKAPTKPKTRNNHRRH